MSGTFRVTETLQRFNFLSQAVNFVAILNCLHYLIQFNWYQVIQKRFRREGHKMKRQICLSHYIEYNHLASLGNGWMQRKTILIYTIMWSIINKDCYQFRILFLYNILACIKEPISWSSYSLERVTHVYTLF